MSAIYEKPLELLQTLVRYDTTNPPGNEGEIVQYLQNLLRDAGLETTILAKADNRPNLIARLPGQGSAPPLLLQAHTDVVTTANHQHSVEFDSVTGCGFNFFQLEGLTLNDTVLFTTGFDYCVHKYSVELACSHSEKTLVNQGGRARH